MVSIPHGTHEAAFYIKSFLAFLLLLENVLNGKERLNPRPQFHNYNS